MAGTYKNFTGGDLCTPCDSGRVSPSGAADVSECITLEEQLAQQEASRLGLPVLDCTIALCRGQQLNEDVPSPLLSDADILPAGILLDEVSNTMFLSSGSSNQITALDSFTFEVKFRLGLPVVNLPADGSATSASFRTPTNLLYSSRSHSMLVLDTLNYALRQVDLDTLSVTTLGVGTPGFSSVGTGSDGIGIEADLDGPVAAAQGADPSTIYLADGHRIRVLDLENKILTTLAGSGIGGFYDGTSRLDAACMCIALSEGSFQVMEQMLNLTNLWVLYSHQTRFMWLNMEDTGSGRLPLMTTFL